MLGTTTYLTCLCDFDCKGGDRSSINGSGCIDGRRIKMEEPAEAASTVASSTAAALMASTVAALTATAVIMCGGAMAETSRWK